MLFRPESKHARALNLLPRPLLQCSLSSLIFFEFRRKNRVPGKCAVSVNTRQFVSKLEAFLVWFQKVLMRAMEPMNFNRSLLRTVGRLAVREKNMLVLGKKTSNNRAK